MPFDGKPLDSSEIEKIKRWIDEGAKEDIDTVPKEFLEIDSVPKNKFENQFFSVYCRATQPCYLVLNVLDPVTKETLLTRTATVKWEKDYGDATKPGHFIDWFIKAETNWPDLVSVKLTYSYPGKVPTNTVFFIQYKERWPFNDNAGNDHGISSFVPDPIKPPKFDRGQLSFWLNEDCDVDIQISQVKTNLVIYKNSERDLEKGLNSIVWNVEKNQIKVNSGAYYARLRCLARETKEFQYDMAILFTVKREDE